MREEFFQERDDKAAFVFRDQALLVDPAIIAVDQHGDCGRVGRGPADAEFFHALDQRRFRKARWRLREMLVGVDSLVLQHITLAERRQAAAVVIALGIVLALFDDAVFVVAAFFIDFQEAVEGNDRAVCAQAVGFVIAPFDLNFGGRLLDVGGRHLARNRALPNKFVKCGLIFFHELAHGIGLALGIGRADGFMRFLRVLSLGFVFAREGRVVAAELGRDHIADLADGFGHNLHAVGPHISDETNRLAADIDALV